MADLYESMKKYQVQAENVESFLQQYYKHDRYKARGNEYAKACLGSANEDIEKYGYAMITHHSSVTGETVTYYPEKATI